MTRRLSRASPAKINLGLEVVGRRSDGYHELVTIFQTVSLLDRITVEPASELQLATGTPSLTTSTNLCLRAAAALQAAAGTQQGALIRLTKQIPIAAGLGGGSSNAATTLLLLNELWDTGLDAATLAEIAVDLGADVPFFLGHSATALAHGIGERLTPLPSPPPLWLVLARPRLRLANKTARLYRALSPADWTDGSATLRQAERLRTGQPIMIEELHNVFTRPLLAEFPSVGRVLTRLHEAGAATAFPAGSGPTIVAVCANHMAAEALAHRLTDGRLFVRVVSTLTAATA